MNTSPNNTPITPTERISLGSNLPIGSLVGADEIAEMRRINQIYKAAKGFDQISGALVMASELSGRTIKQVNADQKAARSVGYISAGLVLNAAIARKNIQAINEVFDSAEGDGNLPANLVSAQVFTNKPLAELNKLSTEIPFDNATEGILVVAASLARKTSAEILAMYDQAKVSLNPNLHGVPAALLVLAAALAKTEMPTVNLLYSKAGAEGGTLAAWKVLLSLVHKVEIEKVVELFEKSPEPDEADFYLAQAALVSGRTFDEIKFLFDQLHSINYTGRAMAVLAHCLRSVDKDKKQFDVLPINYTIDLASVRGGVQKSSILVLTIPKAVS